MKNIIKTSDSILRIFLALAMVVLPCGSGFNKGSTAQAQMVMPTESIPHYFGPVPNWAYSPTIRKFVDALPGLGAANANALGQYIPIANPDTRTYAGSDYYEIALVEYSEQMHSDLPSTKLRGYVQLNNGTNSATNQNTIAPDPVHYLGPVIIARKDRPVRVKFTNMLPTGEGGNLFIPVDPTVMGAGMGPKGLVVVERATPLMGTMARVDTKTPHGFVAGDMVTMHGFLPREYNGHFMVMPEGVTPTSFQVMLNSVPSGPADLVIDPEMNRVGVVAKHTDTENYTQNRASVHLHGGNSPWISDGSPHQWITPAGENTSYPKGVAVENVPDMPAPGDGSMTFFYTNQQGARFMFYHDHAWGITRLNVYTGQAAGYLLTDNTEEGLINQGVLPDQGTPAGVYRYGIPLVIQDRTFVDANTIGMTDPLWRWGTTPGIANTGDLWYPHVYMPAQNPGDPSGMSAFGRWHYCPWFWPPTTNIMNPPIPNPYFDPMNPTPEEPALYPGVPHPSMAMEAFMDTPIVNGTAYPYLNVERKAYRFRILNAADDRFFNLQLYYADTGGGGTGASAITTVTGGAITAITVTNGGTGYTVPPRIMITDDSGTGAKAIATVVGGAVTGITVTNGGSGYSPNPVITFAGGGPGGSGAAATAQIANGKISQILVADPGTGYTSPPGVIILGDGTGAFAETSIDPVTGGVIGITVVDGGTGFTTAPSIIIGGLTEVKMVKAVPNEKFPVGWPTDGRAGGVPDPTTSGPEFIQIGTEGGFLPQVAIWNQQPIDWNRDATLFTAGNVSSHNLLLGCAERADIIIDFSQVPDGSTLILYNDAPAAFPALDPRYDYYTGAPDMTDTGGTVTPLPGFGPNTRTIMQFKVSGPASAPYNLAALETALPAAFEASQPSMIIPQTYLPGTNNAAQDTHSSIHDTSLTFSLPNNALGTVTLTNGGSGYTTPPTVSINGGGGNGAQAETTISKVVNSITLTNGGSGFTTAPTVTITGGGGKDAVAVATIDAVNGIVTGVTVTNKGTGYLSTPTVTISDGGGTGATAVANMTGVVDNIWLSNGGTGYTGNPIVTISGGGGSGATAVASAIATINMEPKALHDEASETFEIEYGRMSGKMGLELRNTAAGAQNFTLQNFMDPPTEIINDGEIQIWKITHNGVDTHPIHFHLFDVQVINRVGWDNLVFPPDPNEIGWKETVRISPLQDTIVALRPRNQTTPFDVPENVRLLDPSMPRGSTMGFAIFNPYTGDPLTVPTTNEYTNFGREYMYHCHILGHEEMDMMRPMIFKVRDSLPGKPGILSVTPKNSSATVDFVLPLLNSSRPITSYRVTASPGGRSATGLDSPITVNGLTNGTAYTFTVTATNALGTGPASDASSEVIPTSPPGMPTGVTAVAGNAQATVSFNSPNQNGSSPIISYTVTSNPDNIIATGTSSPITVTGLTNGMAYRFTVTATNSAGTGNPSLPSNSVTPNPSQVPGAPRNVSARAGSQEAYVTFSPPTPNGGSPITSYTAISNVGGFTASAATSPITVTGLTNGTRYQFRVTATNVNGTGPVSALSTRVTPTTPTQPGPPTGVTAVAGNAQATVSFVAPSANGSPINRYTVRSSPGNRTVNGTASPITVTGLTNGTTYTFTVTARNARGTSLSSAPSNSVTPPGGGVIGAPGAPTGVTAVAGINQATVSFTPPASSGGSPITSYTVTASTGNITATGTQSPITITGLAPGGTYTFTVTATNGIGTGPASAPSNSVSMTNVPAAPTIGIATAGNRQATVSFTPSASTGGSPITGYTVVANGMPMLMATGMSSPITVTGLTNGTAYTFSVKATNAIGDSLPSAISNTVIPKTVPGSPTAVVATSGNAQVSISFMPPMDDGGSAITSYTCISIPGNITTTGNASPITVTGLSNGTPYTFIVKAANAVGSSGASAPSNSVIPMTGPDAPTNVTAVAGNAQATVSFTAPSSNGSAITAYTVTSNPAGGIDSTIPVNATRRVITGLTNGTAYTFTVTATSAAGISVASVPSNSVTPATVPDAPTQVSAVAGNTQATVSFTPPVSDGGKPIIMYMVTSNPGNIVRIGTGSPITVTGLTNGTAYTFTVLAVNAIGMGPSSAASLSVTPTATVPGTPTSVTAVAGDTQATVGFAAPTSDGGSPITGYTVTSSPAGGLDSNAGTTLTTHIITGLTNGVAYTFTATATNAIGTSPVSAPSNSVTPAAIGAPGAPTQVTAIGGNAQATVSFTPPTLTGGSPILFYTVTSNPGGLTATGPASPLTVTGLVNGTAYTFTVTATNSAGVGAISAASNSATPDIIPDVPTAVSAIAGNAQATVSFSPPVANGGSAVTNYTVTSIPGGQTATGAASPLTVLGLTNGTAYTFTVTATNGAGTGAASAVSNSVVPAGSPSAPTTVTATGGNTQATVTFSGALDNGSPITSYTVTSAPGGQTATGAASPLIVTGLTNGTAYTFTVTATNGVGTSTASAASNSVTPDIVPDAPTQASAVAGDMQATVSFTAPAPNGGSPVTGYTVTSLPGGQTATGAASPLTVLGLTNGTAYTFVVTASNATGPGAVSAPSNSVTPAGLPVAPATVTAVPGDTQATVSFSGALDNGNPITSYNVTSTPGGQTATGAASPLTVLGLTNGTAYTFTVTATNAVGTSTASAASNSVTPATVPGAPGIGTATAGDTQATVTFTAPVSDGGNAITSYTATSNPGGITATGAASPLTVLGLTNGTAYTFTVTANNAIGSSPASAISNSVIPAGMPSAPTVVTATTGDAQATVTFSGENANGMPITTCTVTSSPGGITATGAASPITVTGLTNGTAYTFTVTVTTAIGSSPASAASNSVTPATVPGAPAIGAATAGDTQATVDFTPPANDGGNAITGYTVTSSPGGITAIGPASPITVTGLSNGTGYTFTVRANNAIGVGAASAASNSVTPAGLPSAPTTVTAVAGDAKATVTFSGENYNGSPITTCTVTSSPGGITATGQASPITVTGLANDTAYTFTITTTNAIGTSAVSVNSNSVTPIAIPPAPTNFTATASVVTTVSANADLKWQENAPGGLTGFTLQRSSNSNFASISKSVNLGPTVRSYTDTGLSRGFTTYYYRIQANNGSGSSGWTTLTVVTPR